MTVLSGSQGGLSFKGAEVQCRSWTLNTTQEALETTDLSTLDRTYLYGRIDGTGEATVLYDPEDTGAVEMLNTIFSDNSTEDSIAFTLSVDDSVAYVETGFLTSVGTSVSLGAAHACRIRFQLSDTAVTINITGPDRTPIDTTRQYFSAVDGAAAGTVEGYLWTSMGATFDDPTAQNPNVTFNTPGDITLKVTATLQGGQQVEDTLVVTVTQDPIFLSIRPMTPLMNQGGASKVVFDFYNGRNFIYWIYLTDPINNDPQYFAISKFDRQGQYISTWKLERGVNGGTSSQSIKDIKILPTSGDIIILLVAGRVYNSEDFRSRFIRLSGTDGSIIQSVSGYWGNAYWSIFENGFFITDDEQYLYTVNVRDQFLFQSVADLAAPGIGWKTENGAFFVSSNPGTPYQSDLYRVVGQDTAGNIYTNASGVLWQFAPNFGGNIPSGIALTSAKVYTQSSLADKALPVFTPLGVSTVKSTTIANINGSTFAVDDRFTLTGLDHTEDRPAIGVSASIGQGVAAAAPGQPTSSGFNTTAGMLFYNADMRTSPKHINLVPSGLGTQNSRQDNEYDNISGLFATTQDAYASGDARFTKWLLVGDTNAAPGTYTLIPTASEGDFASNIRGVMQIGDNTGYAPATTPLETGLVDDYNVNIVPRGMDSQYANSVDWVTSSVTHTYDVQLQAP